MSYLEELLPEFRKGAKIRRVDWNEGAYIVCKGTFVVNNLGKTASLTNSDIVSEIWELYEKPIDWDYIIKNKSLCLFWDDDEKDFMIGLLRKISKPFDQFGEYKFKDHKARYWENCRPVRRDEVTFYEDKKDE